MTLRLDLLDIPETKVAIPFYDAQIELPAFYLSKTPITVDQWSTVATTFPQVKNKIAEVHTLNQRTDYLSTKHLNAGTFCVQVTEFLRRVSQETGRNWTLCSEAQSLARDLIFGYESFNFDIRMVEILADGYSDRIQTEGYFDQEKKCWVSKRGQQLCHSMYYSDEGGRIRSSIRWGSVFYPRVVFRIASFEPGQSQEETLNFLGVKC